MELKNKLNWTFLEEVAAPQAATKLLIAGEKAAISYRTIRDYATFTNKRLIVVDSQGITGKKKEIYSIPYTSIVMWSTENAGTLDINSEVELWTKIGSLKIKLSRGVDVRKFEKILAHACL